MTIGTIGHIGLSVFKESVRDRVPYNLVLFAILMIGASYMLGQLTAGQELKIIKDLGLVAMSVFGLFIAVFIGIGLVSKEVERRSIYSLLAKPISRSQLVVGKYLGLVLTLAVNLGVMALALYAVLGYMDWVETEEFKLGWEAPAMDPALLVAMYLIFVSLMLVTAIALLFSTFSSPLLSAAMTLGVYVTGHFSEDLLNLNTVLDSGAATSIATGLYYILPNFAAYDVKASVVHGVAVPPGDVLWATGYGLVYVVALLLLSTAIFRRRDFK